MSSEDKKNKKSKIYRNDDLEKLRAMQQGAGTDEDDEDLQAVFSTYLPRRRIRLLGKRLLRLDKIRLFLLAAALIIALLFVASFIQEKQGNFTINLDRLEMFRKGISISADKDFTVPTSRLTARSIQNATNISINDLPNNLDDIDGDHNGVNYVAYTYYPRNAGKEDVDYKAQVLLESAAKGAEEAVRIAIWRNEGDRVVYAAPSANGKPEKGCVNFIEGRVICEFEQKDFKVGYVDKYTVVIWLEGDDPECVDKIVGGSVEISMNVYADNEVNTTLLQKYIADIKDTLNDTKPISAAGNESPDFQKYQHTTWDTRLNKDNTKKTDDTKTVNDKK